MVDGNSPVRCVAEVGAILGEGPVWDARDGAVYWVDIEGHRIFRYHPATGALRDWETPFRVSSLGPRAAGGFVAGTERGFAIVDFDCTIGTREDHPVTATNGSVHATAGRRPRLTRTANPALE